MKSNQTKTFLISTRRSLLTVGYLAGAALVGTASGADEATADKPRFEDKSLWPEDVQKTAYFKETWPKAPLYIWATTVKDGKATDPKDPANWTVDGKPATAAPGELDDVLFPVGSVTRLKENASLSVRNITVEKGVRVVKPIQIKPLGNVWIKAGGCVEDMSTFYGAKNVFLRNDNRDIAQDKAAIANKIAFNKPIGSSIEIIGTVMSWDEMGFFCGTVVVGPDAALVPGNRSTQPIFPDAQLVLMSGASCHKRGNQPYENDFVVSGRFLAGTPERPLTRDCTLGLSFKTKGETGVFQQGVDIGGRGGKNDFGMVVNPKGEFSVTSADPKKARLVVTWNGLSSAQHKDPHKPDPTSRLVDLVLQGKVVFNGVCFDHIRTGGILIGDPSIAKQGGISFGEHNEGKPGDLFKTLEKPIEAKLEFGSAAKHVPVSQGGGKGHVPAGE